MNERGCFRDCEGAWLAREPSECNLARGCAMLASDLFQDLAAFASRGGKAIGLALRRISDDGDVMGFAPRYDLMLDRALVQMIEHLVAGDMGRDRIGRFEVCDVEIAQAPGPDLAVAAQGLEGGDRPFQRMRARPMKKIAIERFDLEPLQGALAGRDRSSRGSSRSNATLQLMFRRNGQKLRDSNHRRKPDEPSTCGSRSARRCDAC